MERMTLQNATKRWLDSGFIKITGSKPLFELKEKDYFYKDGMLCRLKISTRAFCSWFDITNTEHFTSNTSQRVGVIEWQEKEVEEYVK